MKLRKLPLARLVHSAWSMIRLTTLALVTTGVLGCATPDTTGDGRDDSFTTDGKLDGFSCTPAEAAAILQVVNTASLNTLKTDVGLTTKAADNIVAVRKGDDEQANTADDVEFGSLAQLDAVPYIGPTAFAALLQYVHDADLVDDTVPTGTMWTSETIANGGAARMAITPDNKLVLTMYDGSGGEVLRLANGTLVPLPDSSAAKIAVDENGTPHVFTQKWVSPGYQFNHMSYRNGQLVQHGQLGSDLQNLWVDQNPDGTIFALGRQDCSNCYATLTLFAVDPAGTTTAETLWGVSSSANVSLTVGDDGFPAILHGRDYEQSHHARRGANGWTRLDATPSHEYRSVASTGGPNATLVVAAGKLVVYRQNGTAFHRLETLTQSTDAIELAVDPHGTVHGCYVGNDDNVYHLKIETTGAVTSQSLGNADRCMIAAAPNGTIHMITNLGPVVNHLTLQ